MIDQLIAKIVAEIGLDQSTAQKALGTLFSLLQKEGDGAAVGALLDKLPGAAELADQFGAEGGGLLGGLAGAAGGLLGGKAGGALEAMAALKEAGVSMDDAKSMMPVVTDFMKQNAGEDVVKAALSSVPALSDFLK